MKSFFFNLILYICFFFLLHPLLLTGHWYLGWDAVRESYGDILYGAKAIFDGYFPLWNHLERGGYPFFADPQTAVLYPPSWLLYAGIYFFGDGIWVALARSILHFLIGAFGMRKLLLELGCSRLTLWFGSLLWMSSARFAKSKDSAALWSIVWLPWLFFCTHRFFTKPNLKHAIYFAFFIALAFYAGYPPNLFRSLLLLLPYALYLIYQQYQRHLNNADDPKSEQMRQAEIQQEALLHQSQDQSFTHQPIRYQNPANHYLWQVFGFLSLAIIFSIFLCLPGILATIDVLPHTLRGELSDQDLFGSKQKLSDFADLFWPRLFSPQGYAYLYLGIFPGFLAFLSLQRSSQQVLKLKAALFQLLGISFVFFTLLACSKQALVLPVIMRLIPIFKLWRIPEQYLLISVFSLILLSSFGFEALIRQFQNRQALSQQFKKYLLYFLMPGALIYLLVLVIKQGFKNQYQSLPFIAPLAILLMSSIFLAILHFEGIGKIKPQKALLLIVFFTFVDISIQNQSIYRILDKIPSFHRDQELLNALKKAQKSPNSVRILDNEYFQYRIGARREIEDFQGRFSTMVSARHQSYLKAAQKAPQLYALAGIHYIAGPIQKNLPFIHHKPKDATLFNKLSAQLYQSISPSPLAYFCPTIAQESPQLLNLLAQSQQSPPAVAYIDFNTISTPKLSHMLQEKISSQSSMPLGTKVELPVTRVSVITHHWGKTHLKISQPQEGMLVLLNHWFPHFKASFLNQQLEAEVLRVNYLFQGVYLPKSVQGMDELDLVIIYRPWAILGSLIFTAILSLVLLFVLWKQYDCHFK